MIKLLQSGPIAGVFWMIVTGILFVFVTALVKYLGTDIPAVQAAFMRYALGVVLLVPLIGETLRTRFTREMWKVLIWRGVFHCFGVSLWFYAMARIPIADVTAMNYLSPIYVTLGAALFLGERLALRRIAAVTIALIGAIIILRPGFREIGAGHIAMLFAAVFFGGSYLLAKRASDMVAPSVVVLMLSLTVPIGLAPVAIGVWMPPDVWDVVVLFVVAILATLGHYTMTLAFKAAPVSVTQPVTFLQLIWAVLLGVFVFSEPLDIWVVLGGLLILLSVSFISWREYLLKKKSVTPPPSAMKL